MVRKIKETNEDAELDVAFKVSKNYLNTPLLGHSTHPQHTPSQSSAQRVDTGASTL